MKLAGLNLSAPVLGMVRYLPPPMKFFALYLLPHLKELLAVPGVQPYMVSRKPEIVRRFLTDMKCVPFLGGGQMSYLVRMSYALKYNAELLKVPTYIHLAGKEKNVGCSLPDLPDHQNLKKQNKIHYISLSCFQFARYSSQCRGR